MGKLSTDFWNGFSGLNGWPNCLGVRTPAAVTMKAIEKILALKGVENMKPGQSDLVKFLEQKGNYDQ